jgi:Integrase core domain
LFVVPTLTFERLFAFLVLGHGRRQLLWFEVTRHPTAEWLARQITEAFPWASAPAYLVRDNDRAYGHVFTSRVRAMGIRDRPISPRSPWQNPYVERLIGTVRRECLDRVLMFGEAHLRQILSSYAAYYNEVRTHLALGKDAPAGRAVQRSGAIVAIPSCPGCTTITSGYNFRKGQVLTPFGQEIETTQNGRPHLFKLSELRFATARAANSSFSRAIFCASMTSPNGTYVSGPKHKTATRLPSSSSSSTFICRLERMR